MKTRPNRKPLAAPVARAEPQTAVEDTSLADAADVLFGTEENPVELRGGEKIVVSRAKVAHVGLLLGFFNALVANMSKDDIVTLVTLIEEQRTKVKKDLTIDGLVEQAFGRSSLLVSVFQATHQAMPDIVSALTPLSKERWDNLDMDEGILLAVSIFQVNYHFFSQNLPHAMRGFLALAAKKVADK